MWQTMANSRCFYWGIARIFVACGNGHAGATVGVEGAQGASSGIEGPHMSIIFPPPSLSLCYDHAATRL